MSEVIKRDKRVRMLAALYSTMKRDSDTATMAMVTVWQAQLNADWLVFETMQNNVLDRAGISELEEQHSVFDDAYNYHYKSSMLLEELRIRLAVQPPGEIVDKNEQLRLRHGAIGARIAAMCNRIIAAGEAVELVQIDVQRQALQELYASYQDVGLQRITNGVEQEQVLAIERETDALYMNAAGALAAAKHRHAQLNAAANPANGADTLKIPALSITPFDGRSETWEAFRESFRHGIHDRQNMNAVQKLQFLKSVLRGEPEEALRNFTLTADNYESAWKLLNDQYDNKRELVDSHLRVLTTLPTCRASASELRSLTNKTTSSIMALNNLGRPTNQWDDWIVFHVCAKLDSETRRMWEQQHETPDELPTWTKLDKFLQGRIRALTCTAPTLPAKPHMRAPAKSHNARAHQSSTSKNTRETNTQSPVRQYVCAYCGRSHLITFCEEFRRKSAVDRRRTAAEKALCFICLNAGHMATQCNSTRVCQVCNAKHNTLLHNSEGTNGDHQVISNRASCSPDIRRHRRPPVLLATAIVSVRDNNGKLFRVRALMDQGSDASFVSEQLAQTLQLKRHRESAEISGVTGVTVGRVKQSIMIEVSDCRNNGFILDVDAYIQPRVTGELLSISDVDVQRWAHIADIELADPEFMHPHSIELLLGSDVYHKALLPGLRKADGLPSSQQMQFGWIMSGGIERRQSPPRANDTVLRMHHAIIETQLTRFWELEEAPTQRHLTADETRCEMLYEKSVSRDESGRIHVRIPMRHDNVIFGESQRFAVQRQVQLERRFACNQQFAESYREFMFEYEQLGHMREVAGADVDLSRTCAMLSHTRREYYIPHHAVLKEASTTTKLRVVFDASRQTTNGTSLNEQMLVGPRLQDDLTTIMMRWRKFRVAFCADIAKMYRQIIVDEPDRDLQRIVWRPTTDVPMKVFQLCTVTYGTASAPYLAVKSLQTLAHNERERYPVGAQLALNNFYVDDVLGGANTVKECVEAQAQLNALMTSGGMKLRKWVSNDESVLAMVDPADRECTLPLNFEDDSSVSTLGVQWNPATDELGFKINIPAGGDDERHTMRMFLSAAARLFDPLGWLAPCTIVVKMMFQSFWKQRLNWDDELPAEQNRKWHDIRTSLHQLKSIRIPRWISTTATCEIEIHGFCDASLDGYAAVVYVRVQSVNAPVGVYNICAKTKVAPVKVVSLPRLELCGAVLLVKLINSVKEAMQWPTVDVRCWTDSTIVLAWLRRHPSTFNVFVANRTAEIQQHVPVEKWQHVMSGDNPADCASRGITPRQLLHHRLWWTGPPWLRETPADWPSQPAVPETTEEMRTRMHNTSSNVKSWQLITKYSTWNRLARVTAWCIRFARNCRSRIDERTSGPIRSVELINAREFWLRSSQAEAFNDEMRCLRKKRDISKSSKLRALNPPILSPQNILCVGGRLINAHEMTAASRTPAIVPRRSELSALLVSDAHHQTLHGGPALMLAYLRRVYWIVDGPHEVRRFVQRCTVCFRQSAKPEQQMMAALPAVRVVPSRPFIKSALDYSGAILVRSARGRGHHATKAYFCVFVCMATKAVHIELVGDLTTAGFIAAFERFCARRGSCTDLYSDNATNFVGAAKFLRTERARFDATVHPALASRGTTWHFSPPLSPHFNGLAESAIRSVKHHVRRVIGETTLTYEELTTVLTKIEACLNSRPLCPMRNDPDDFDVLTPGHFLVGEPIHTVPQRDMQEQRVSALTRWQLTHQLVHRVWKRWSSEYLHTLQQRRKWQQSSDNMQIGDMVLIIEDNLPPSKWAIGRICEVHPGDDGRVRVVTIRAKGSTFKRSVVKVARLPIDIQPADEEPRTTAANQEDDDGGTDAVLGVNCAKGGRNVKSETY